jgi:hypothetical protein
VAHVVFSSHKPLQNFSARAVRAQQDIECNGWKIQPEHDKGTAERMFTFNASMADTEARKSRNDPVVLVRDEPRLAVWTHNYTFDSSTKATVTLISAALSGTIDKGTLSN